MPSGVNNILIINNRALQITGQVAVFLHTLRKYHPHTVSNDHLRQALWGSIGGSDVTLRVIAGMARQSLRLLGTEYAVIVTYGAGYRLKRNQVVKCPEK